MVLAAVFKSPVSEMLALREYSTEYEVYAFGLPQEPVAFALRQVHPEP